MRILTPINQEEYIPALVEAGATEFYMGFTDPAWQERYGKYSDINRLTLFRNRANRYTIDDIGRIAAELHSREASLYITLNAPGYTSDQMKDISLYLKRLAEARTDGVIISEPELIPLVSFFGLKPVASTMCGIFNSDLAQYYKNMGIRRVILPRELTTEEIADVMNAVSDAEYEVFLMRNGCRYSDANCLSLHGGEAGAFCGCIRQGQVRTFSRQTGQDTGVSAEGLMNTHRKFCHEYHVFSCGQCAIWRFVQMGVTAVKIVGRMDDSEDIIRDVRLTAENIRIAGKCETEWEYLEQMRMPGDRDSYCRNGMSCYYPEVCYG